ncbi:MAG: ROK family transcriptional regulator [Bacteroidales bacterium]
MFTFKSENHKKILQIIRLHQGISGAEMARMTGLQASTIGYIIQHLNEKGLIREKGLGNTTNKGGKKPLIWGINDSAAYLIGLEIVKSQIRGIVVGLAGEIILRMEKDFYSIDQENIVEKSSHVILEMLQEAGLEKNKILSTCIAIPGIVDTTNSEIIMSNLLQIQNFKLSNHIYEQTGLETYIVNDANAGALGEQWYYQPQGNKPENIIYINFNQVSTDIGVGIIIRNRLYTGNYGTAGEIISAIPIYSEWIKEKKGSGKITETESSNPKMPGNFTLIDFYEAYKKGVQPEEQFFTRLNKYLTEEISRLIALLNPDKIIFGGEITSCSGWLEKLLIPSIKKHLTTKSRIAIPLPEMKFSSFGIFSVALGATGITLSKKLETEY